VEIGSGVQLGEGAFDTFWDTFREAYNKGGAGMYTRNKKYDWVKIDKIINVTGMNIFENSFNMPLTDEWVALHLDIFPLDATNKKVVLTSSNPSVVSVSQPTYFREAGHDAYFYIHSESAGTAIITATSEDGGYTSKCIITVYPW